METSNIIPICRTVSLPPHLVLHAAHAAVSHNPSNAPPVVMTALVPPTPLQIAVMTGRRWQNGTTLTVDFMEAVDPALRGLILSHMSAWSTRANIRFVYSKVNPVIRITLQGQGYYSYIGTDALSIPADTATMCLENWSLSMPDSECRRVLRHEAGHALGAVHEHARAQIVRLLDPAKTKAFFFRDQGWSEAMVDQQILTPLDESTLMGTTPEQDSEMCYQFSGECTYSGEPIPGGLDITEDDYAFMSSIYPMPSTPPPVPIPVPPPTTPPPAAASPSPWAVPRFTGLPDPAPRWCSP